MQAKMFSSEAIVAVYEYVKKQGSIASGPIAYPIGGRQDAFVCWAIVEGKKPPLVAVIFIVGKSKDNKISVYELFGAFGLRFIGGWEELGRFFIKIGGPGIKAGLLKVPLEKLGLEPLYKSVRVTAYN